MTPNSCKECLEIKGTTVLQVNPTTVYKYV